MTAPIASIPYFRESGAPRVIGATAGAPMTDEALFFQFSYMPAMIVSPGGYVLAVFDNGTASLYRRTRVELPEDIEAEPVAPYFKFYKEVVSTTNGRNLGSIVSVGAMFDPNTGIPESPWLRVVAITDITNGVPSFGLAELS